jgi:hypothetical protein
MALNKLKLNLAPSKIALKPFPGFSLMCMFRDPSQLQHVLIVGRHTDTAFIERRGRHPSPVLPHHRAVEAMDMNEDENIWANTTSPSASPGFGGLYAHVGDYEQIDHCLGLLHGDLLHSLDVDPITEGIDDLDVLDVRDSVPGIIETFHVVPETLIILLSDGLHGLCWRWTLVRALQVSNEYGT